MYCSPFTLCILYSLVTLNVVKYMCEIIEDGYSKFVHGDFIMKVNYLQRCIMYSFVTFMQGDLLHYKDKIIKVYIGQTKSLED